MAVREKIADWVVKAVGREPKRAPIGTSMSFGFTPGWTTRQYVESYGNVGWVFACASRIAQAVGEAEPLLFKGKGENRVLIDDHPFLDIFRRPTPFHTQQEAMEISQSYLDLTGEWAWLVFRDRLGPREFWPVNPQQITIVPHPTEYISGYVYTSPDGMTKVPLEKQNVMFLRTPNPQSTYRGMGVIQSIMADVDAEHYTAMWNRNFFINGGDVGGVIEIPHTLTLEKYEELKTQYAQGHQGVARAHNILILQGGAKFIPPRMGLKDMDFANLRKTNRDVILGAFGMPAHMLGLEESTNRATAESAEYVFARWVVLPRLRRIEAKINEFLLPQFPNSEDLDFEFEDPTPEDKAYELQLAKEGFINGLLTRNEGRSLLGMDDLGEVGDVFFVPIALIPQGKNDNPTESMTALPPLPTEEALPIVQDVYSHRSNKWDESEHPRVPAGEPDGGQFTDAGGGEGTGGGEGHSERSSRARASYKPASADIQRQGDTQQRNFAKQIKGKETGDNEAFDVIRGDHAIEFKTIVRAGNDKITMHPSSRRRKLSFAEANGVTAHTVVSDLRSGKLYYKAGVGSYRLSSMTEVSTSDLEGIFA